MIITASFSVSLRIGSFPRMAHDSSPVGGFRMNRFLRTLQDLSDEIVIKISTYKNSSLAKYTDFLYNKRYKRS